MKMRLLTGMILLFAIVSSCNRQKKKVTNWAVRLQRTDTTPYGTQLAYAAAVHYFPDAQIKPLSKKFRYTSITPEMQYQSEGAALLVAVGLDFRLSQDEMEELLDFAKAGNEVLVFCSLLDEKLGKKLHLEGHSGEEERPLNKVWNRGDANLNVLSLAGLPGKRFGHNGRDLKGYFEYDSVLKEKILTIALDTSYATKPATDFIQSEGYYGDGADSLYAYNDSTYEYTEEYDAEGDTTIVPDVMGFANNKPNFLRFALGSGHLTVHLAPLTLSNYFLLQGDNRRYLDGLWSSLPADISVVYWHEYFKRSSEASSFAMLWRHPATRWALILAIIALGLYVLFESKRRQRIIPVIKPLENTSVAFVETVGRLYFNRGDHANLAAKMVQHFLEWVRNTHGLSTTELNEELALTLARRSGRPEREAKAALYMANEVRVGNFAVTEEYIHQLYKAFQPFYDSTHS